MAKNQEFLELIEELQSLKLDTNRCAEALDALIIIEDNKHEKLVEAVNKHRAFWNQAYRVKHPEQDLFPQELDAANNDFLAPDPAQPDYHAIQQAAITQRAKFAIATKRDEVVLLKILNNNKDECRDYLGRVVVGILEDHPKWQDSEIPDREQPIQAEDDEPIIVNESEDTLPDATIEILQKYAAARFAISYLERLNRLPNAGIEFASNQDFKEFLQPADLPQDQRIPEEKLNFLDKNLFLNELKFYREKSAALLETLYHELEQLDFAQVDQTTLANKKTLITTAPHDVYELIEDNQYKYAELSLEDVKKLQLAVGKKYLMHTLNALEANAALGYLNQTAAQLQGSLKSLPQLQGHNYIDTLVANQEDLKAIKKSLAHVCKDKLKADFKTGIQAKDLNKLDAAATPENFYTLLFQKLPHLEAMKPYIIDDLDLFNALKNDITALQIPDLLKKVGIKANGAPAFTELLLGLSQADRQALVNRLNTSAIVRFSLTTNTNEDALKHFLGDAVVSENAVKKLVAENQQRARINSITNAEIAQILLNMPLWSFGNPAREITQDQIDGINQAIKARQANDDDSYRALITKIEEILVLPPDLAEQLGKNFGITPNQPITDDIKRKIDAEQQRNSVLNSYVIRQHEPISQNLVNFMLSVRKMDNGLVHAINTMPQLEQSLKSIAHLLLTSEDVHTFSQRMTPSQTEGAFFNFLKKLTPERFHQLQQELQKLRLDPNSADQSALKGELARINRQIQNVKKQEQNLYRQLTKLEPLNQVMRIDVYNPGFRLRLNKHQAENREMAQACRVAVEQLSHYHKVLTQYQENLVGNWANTEHEDDIEQLNSELTTELENITQALKKYQIIEQKIAQISTWMTEISTSTKVYGYDGEHVNSYLATREELVEKAVAPKAAQGLQVQVDENEQVAEDAALFKPLPLPDANKVRVFDVVHTYTQNNNQVQVEGRFIYELKSEDNRRVEAAKHNTQKTFDNGYYEVLKFPEAAAKDASELEKAEKETARMKFGLTLAIQALAGKSVLPSRDYPIRIHHGKREELVYVLAAFKALGKSLPKNLRFGNESIQVSSKDALSEQFKEATAAAQKKFLKDPFKAMIQSCTEQMQARHAPEQHKKVSQASSEGVKFYKSHMKKYKEEAEKRQSIEGPTEIPIQAKR